METLFKRAMPWLSEEICIKDAQSQNTTMPGLSLVQWMNMNRHQSSTLANTGIQSEYLRSLSNPAMQNLGAAELARQLYVQNHLLQQNNAQLNASKLPQQMQPINELVKGPLSCNQLDAITNHQELKEEVGNQQRQQQPTNQAIPLSHTQANLVQAQVIIQNQMQQQQQQLQQQKQLSPTRSQQGTSDQQLLVSQQQQDQNFQLQQQQLLLQQLQRQQQQNQQQLNKLPGQLVNLAGQQAQLSDQELQLQLLQKLQQQSLISQPAITLSRLPLIPEQQKLLLDMQQLSSSHSLAQQRIVPQQDNKVSLQLQASQAPPPMKQEQQHKFSQKQVALVDVSDAAFPPISSSNIVSKAGSQLMIPGATQSVLTEEIPSCSTSPSTANGNRLAHPTIGRNEHCKVNMEKVPQLSALMSIPTSGEAVTTPIMAKELSKLNHNLKENVITSKPPTVGTGHDNLLSIVPTDNLETASSATSLWPTQTDGLLHQGFPHSNFNQQQMFKDALPDVEIHEGDPTNNAFFEINNDSPLGFPMETEGLLVSALNPVKCQPNLSTDVENTYRIQKDAQQEISTSIVSQSFGQSDLAFNSIDSAINDGAMLNRNSWPPAPPPQRMRTFTKVCASLHNQLADCITFNSILLFTNS